MSGHSYLTADEVAALMKVTRREVNAKCKRGELPATKFGRWWRIREDLFQEYLARRTNPDPRARTPQAEAARRRRSA